MYCRRCGTKNNDNDGFCVNCGASLQSAQTPEYQSAPNPQGNRGYGARKPLAMTLKEHVTSPLFLTAIIAYSAALLLNLVSVLSGINSLSSWLNRLMSIAGLDEIYSYSFSMGFNAVSRVATALTVVTNLPTILITVGLWLIFASGKDAQSYSVKPLGFSFIRGVEIYYLVTSCIGAVIVEIILLVAVAGLSEYGGAGIVFVLMLLAGGCFAAVIIYHLKAVRMIATIQQTVITGKPNSNIPKYVMIMTFILGGFAGISALTSLVSSFIYFLAEACSATACITFGILLNQYTKIMTTEGSASVQQPATQYSGRYQNYGAPAAPAAPAAPWGNAQSQNCGTAGYGVPAAPAAPVAPAPQQFGETTVLSDAEVGGTTVLRAPVPIQTARLTRLRTNEVVYVNQPVFKIGKDPTQNDYAVSGNSAISRSHAEIHVNQAGFSIVDMNSSNHVYVNTDLIPAGVEIALTSGTTIRLADEDFLFEVC
jgi:hypothetical protein